MVFIKVHVCQSIQYYFVLNREVLVFYETLYFLVKVENHFLPNIVDIHQLLEIVEILFKVD